MRRLQFSLIPCDERGDTLVEVTIATAILSAVLISVFTIANVAIVTGRVSNQRGDAVALEQQQAEMLRNLRDNDLTSGGWAVFTNQIFGAGAGSVCPMVTPVFLHLPMNVGTNIWTPNSDGLSSTIATSSGQYTVATTACYDTTARDKITFNTTTNWDKGGSVQTAKLATSLANVGDIQQAQSASATTTPVVPVVPPIVAAAGTVLYATEFNWSAYNSAGIPPNPYLDRNLNNSSPGEPCNNLITGAQANGGAYDAFVSSPRNVLMMCRSTTGADGTGPDLEPFTYKFTLSGGSSPTFFSLSGRKDPTTAFSPTYVNTPADALVTITGNGQTVSTHMGFSTTDYVVKSVPISSLNLNPGDTFNVTLSFTNNGFLGGSSANDLNLYLRSFTLTTTNGSGAL